MTARKPFTSIAAALFALIALAHLYRIVRPFPVLIDGYQVSQVVSWIAALVAAALALLLWREGRR